MRDTQRRVAVLETIPDQISGLKQDVAVLKSDMEQGTWLLRAMFALVFGVAGERIRENLKKKGTKSGG